MKDSIPHIMLVEDDIDLAQLIADFLSKYQYSVTTVHRGDIAVTEIQKSNPDLVILDLMLPGLDGLSVCKELRPTYCGPIVMLTALSKNIDQVAGLEIGADDYISKPVEPRVLLARVRALLRRIPENTEAAKQHSVITLENDSIQISSSSRSLIVKGVPINLTTREFDLLWLLASHPGVIFSRDDLYHNLRGVPYDGVDRAMDLRISILRKALGDSKTNPGIIKTVRGQGYVFVNEQ